MGSKLAELSFTSDGIAIIRMRNGENRLNPPFVKAMTDALDQVERSVYVTHVYSTVFVYNISCSLSMLFPYFLDFPSKVKHPFYLIIS